MKAENREPVINPENLVLFISHLSLAAYSQGSINIMMYGLQRQEGLTKE